MSFAHPAVWLLAVPAIAAWAVLRPLHRRALDEIDRRVDPRFRAALTRHGRRSLEIHLLFLLAIALLLVVAAAGPSRPGHLETRGGDRVLLVVDASASMYATDVELDGEAVSRFEQARRVAREFVRRLGDDSPGVEIGLVSFSGEPTIHLPMTERLDQLLLALSTLENHNYYKATGSSLSAALDSVFHFVKPGKTLQVVLLGDGELPFEEEYDEVRKALADQGIPVHAATIGSLDGQSRRILDFRDVVAGVDEPAVLQDYTTHRVDEHYERIARATGGHFEIATAGAGRRLAAAIADAPTRISGDAEGGPQRDLTPLFLLLALIAFLVESLLIGRPRQQPSFGFEIDRLGEPTASGRSAGTAAGIVGLAVAAQLLGCATSPIERAHRDNERGITHDSQRRFRAARGAFERSIGFGERSQIPTYNLARTLTRAGSYAEAHEVYQRALEIDPDLVEAYFNDGIALYRWGMDERDPRNCDLERTRDLWQAALDRFELAAERATDSDLARRAGENGAAVRGHLAAVERLIAEPPPHCESDDAESAGGAGGGGGSGAGGGGGTGGGGGAGGGGRSGPGGAGGGGGGGGGGASEPPPPPPAPEQETIAQALARIQRQAYEEGKYHRRTLPEQFSQESWANPDPELWW